MRGAADDLSRGVLVPEAAVLLFDDSGNQNLSFPHKIPRLHARLPLEHADRFHNPVRVGKDAGIRMFLGTEPFVRIQFPHLHLRHRPVHVDGQPRDVLLGGGIPGMEVVEVDGGKIIADSAAEFLEQTDDLRRIRFFRPLDPDIPDDTGRPEHPCREQKYAERDRGTVQEKRADDRHAVRSAEPVRNAVFVRTMPENVGVLPSQADRDRAVGKAVFVRKRDVSAVHQVKGAAPFLRRDGQMPPAADKIGKAFKHRTRPPFPLRTMRSGCCRAHRVPGRGNRTA